MKHVTLMGGVWRVSEKQFKLLKRELQTTGSVEDLDRYGKMIIDKLWSLDEIWTSEVGE